MKAIDIIGAGIGGLTLAIALKQRGIPVRVFEQAPELRAVGAGINLACNAMQVYKALGLRSQLEAVGHLCQSMQVTDQHLHPLSNIDIQPFAQRFAVGNIAIHRAALQEVLAAQLSPDELHLGKKLVEMQESTAGVQLIFADATQLRSQCVVGADGIHSVVRQQWFKQGEIRQTHQICWRGVAAMPLPSPFQGQLTECWGSGGRFGFVQVDAQRTYWFAVMRKSAGNNSVRRQQLIDTYRSFHPLITDILFTTPEDGIHEAPLADLTGLTSWHRGRVALIGDAAHATTPNLGQGACQAIEDAWVLAHYIAEQENVERAFERFQRTRQAKVKQVVNTSWTVGQMAHWQNPLAIRLRNALMRMVPASVGAKQSERIYTLEELTA